MKNKIIALCCGLLVATSAYADDLEVYTSTGSDAKVLFLLDASGSMLLTEGGERTSEFTNTRMETLNKALQAVTDQSIAKGKGGKLQFAMTWFGGLSGSGIKLPMQPLNSRASDLPNVSYDDSVSGDEIAFSDLFLNTARNIFPVDRYDSAYYDLQLADLWKGEAFDDDSLFEVNNVFACGENANGAHPSIDVSSVAGFLASYAATYQSKGFADDNSTTGGVLTDPDARPTSWDGIKKGSWADKNGDAMPASWVQRCPAIPTECTISAIGAEYWDPSQGCWTATGLNIKPFVGEWKSCKVGAWTQVNACQSPFIAMLNDTVTLQTPTVDALFEASRYFRGENVFFGNRDRFPTWDQAQGRYFDDLTAASYDDPTTSIIDDLKLASGFPGNMEKWVVQDAYSYSAHDAFNRDYKTAGWLWGWRAVNPAAVTAETRGQRREFIPKNEWDTNDAEHILANDIFKYGCRYGANEDYWNLLSESFHACNIQESPYTALTDAMNTNSFSLAELREIDLNGTSDYPAPGDSEYFSCEPEEYKTANCSLDRSCEGDSSLDCDKTYTESECSLAGGTWNKSDNSFVNCSFRVKSLQQYDSPISECSNNAIIMISDGSPTSNSADNGLDIDPDVALHNVTFGDYNLNTAGLIRGMIAAEDEDEGVTADSVKCRDFISNISDPSSSAYITNRVGKCGPELAEFMATTPQVEGKPNSTVTTHAIGFNISGPAETFLKEISESGEGLYRSATNQEDLVAAIDQMISVSETDTAEAPALVINLANSSLQSSNVVYAPQFKASTRATWISNIKAYFLSPERSEDGSVIDSTKQYAVGGTRSLWSAEDTVTGGDELDEEEEAVLWENRHAPTGLIEKQIAHGGFNTNLVNGKHRDIYMECDDSCDALSYYKLNSTMPDINLPPAEYYGLASGAGNTPTEQDEERADLISNWFASQPLGDSLHTKPVLVAYEGAYNIPNVGDTVDPQILYVVSNRGLLHAFDVTAVSKGYTPGNAAKFTSEYNAPREIAAWLPAALSRRIPQQYYADGNDDFLYGLDGEIRIWETKEDGVDKTYLLLGMRRGGSAYYKFDISNPAQGLLQKPIWRIDRAFNYDDKWPYEELGQTWSPMSVMRVRVPGTGIGAAGKYVGVFGGGYDESDDIQGKTRISTADQKGRGVYFVDMDTGRLLASIGSAGKFTYDTDAITTGVGNGMKWGVPSEIRVVDSDGDTYADTVYFGDMGGQLWQVEVGLITDSGALKVSPTLLADLGSDDDPTKQRRFYEPPAVAKLSSGELVVVAGSGYRAHPLNGVALDENRELYPVIEDGLFVLKGGADLPLSDSGFANVLSATVDAPINSATKAWKLPLNRAGEKILSEPTIFSNRILFTSTRPTSGGDSCSISTTENRFYAIKLFDGSPSGDLLDPESPTEDPEPVRDIVIDSNNAIESEIAISVDRNKEDCEPGRACGDFYVGVTDVGDYETVPGKVYWKETGQSKQDCRFDENASNENCDKAEGGIN